MTLIYVQEAAWHVQSHLQSCSVSEHQPHSCWFLRLGPGWFCWELLWCSWELPWWLCTQLWPLLALLWAQHSLPVWWHPCCKCHQPREGEYSWVTCRLLLSTDTWFQGPASLKNATKVEYIWCSKAGCTEMRRKFNSVIFQIWPKFLILWNLSFKHRPHGDGGQPPSTFANQNLHRVRVARHEWESSPWSNFGGWSQVPFPGSAFSGHLNWSSYPRVKKLLLQTPALMVINWEMFWIRRLDQKSVLSSWCVDENVKPLWNLFWVASTKAIFSAINKSIENVEKVHNTESHYSNRQWKLQAWMGSGPCCASSTHCVDSFHCSGSRGCISSEWVSECTAAPQQLPNLFTKQNHCTQAKMWCEIEKFQQGLPKRLSVGFLTFDFWHLDSWNKQAMWVVWCMHSVQQSV